MPPANKSRGKSAILQEPAINSSIPVNPLLKIESVVPKISHHRQKLIKRSHSTITSAYLKKVTENRKPVEKSIPSSGEAKPEETSSVQVQNGVYKIKRSKKEKEKFPDRINLDRKGLTAIPFFEDEQLLRLLSLQHNLINVFHVPDSDQQQEEEEVKENISSEKSSSRQENDSSSGSGSTQSTPPDTSIPQLGRLNYTSRLHPKHQIFNYNGSRRYLAPPNYNSGFSTSSSIAPSLLINSISNNYTNFTSGTQKTFQLLNVNQKIILKKTAPRIVQKVEQKEVVQNKEIEEKKDPDPIHTWKLGECLQNLVFLDLYDNQIEKINNLDGLKNLTVLLLGKNRIVSIDGIVSLKHTLRVLDLHGNKIVNISQKISKLSELKSLNLAGNLLRQIYSLDFSGLINLKELNLKRNKIKKISGFEDLRNLERLFLSHNDLQRVEDINCIAKAVNLKEITIENNPVSLAGDCCSFLVSYLPNLMLLSQMNITDSVRRAAIGWRKSKENSDANYASLSTDVGQSIRREEVISNARTNWELLRSQQQSLGLGRQKRVVLKSNKNEKEPDLESSISENNQITKKTAQKLNPNKKLQRSTSQETVKVQTSSPKSTQSPPESEFFRLPPILAPFLDNDALSITKNSSAESSLGPNVDSGSSFSSRSSTSSESDISRKGSGEVRKEEESKKKAELKPETNSNPTKEVFTVPELKLNAPIILETPPEDNEETNNKEDLQVIQESESQSDNKSNLSVTSIKTESSNAEESVSRTKTKSANSGKKLLTPVVLRAQTAKLGHQNSNASSGSVSPGLLKSNSNLNHNSNINNANNSNLPSAKTALDREREQGGDFLIEICGRYLNVYGVGALKFIDKQWNIQKALDVHTVKFSYINFNNICQVFSKIKCRFQNAENFVFRETNIMCLGQLNSLSEIQGINSLVIEPEGNLICTKNWRSYAIFRLNHWGLKLVNGITISEEEIAEADLLYSRLSDLVLWSLPEQLVAPLLNRLRLDETSCQVSKKSAKDWLMQSDHSLKAVVGKEALQWKKSATFIGNNTTNNNGTVSCSIQDEQAVRNKGKLYFSVMMENTCNAVEKLQKLQTLWPQMCHDMIRNILMDYSQYDTYVKNLLAELFK